MDLDLEKLNLVDPIMCYCLIQASLLTWCVSIRSFVWWVLIGDSTSYVVCVLYYVGKT